MTTFREMIAERGNLVSLYDLLEFMKVFNLHVITDSFLAIGRFVGIETKPGNRTHAQLIEMCEALDFPCALRDANRVSSIVADNLTDEHPDFSEQLHEALKSLRSNFKTEASSVVFLYMERDKSRFWNEPFYGWTDMLNSLPQQVVDDISEASKCYACGRATACVMHLCRVLECGFKDFATRHGVTFKKPIDQTSWEQLSEDLKLHRDTNKETLSSNENKAINTVRDQIVALKGMWRNPVMHSTGTFYTEEQALAILYAVQVLMRDLVTL